MKTANLPSVRVDPKLRKAAEDVLDEGESLSGFVEESIRVNVARRRAQREFIARGIVSRDSARRSGLYISSDTVVRGLERMLASAKSKPKARSRA